ncbi:MAG: hypothetical protein ACKOEY_00240 [Phenylobacterium sp.]
MTSILILFSAGYGYSEILYVSGRTDKEMYDKIKRLGQNVDTVEIDSFGGIEEIALEIASVVAANNLTVKVRRYCLSSCAMYILAAARKVIVSEYAIVGFHVPSVGNYQVMRRAAPESKFTHKIGQIAKNTEQLYESVGKDISILRDAFIQSEIYCISLHRTDGEVTSATGFFVVDVWTPDRASLAANGWEVEGFWPSSQEEVDILRQFYFKPQAIVRFGKKAGLERPVITVSEVGCPARSSH